MTERSDKMSVIGRLDDQVEAVLINPLKRRERDDSTQERDAPSPPQPAPLNEERDAESSAESSAETRDTEAALPVWLL